MKTTPLKDGDAATRSEFAKQYTAETGSKTLFRHGEAFNSIPVAAEIGNGVYHYINDYPHYAEAVNDLMAAKKKPGRKKGGNNDSIQKLGNAIGGLKAQNAALRKRVDILEEKILNGNVIQHATEAKSFWAR